MQICCRSSNTAASMEAAAPNSIHKTAAFIHQVWRRTANSINYEKVFEEVVEKERRQERRGGTHKERRK